MDRSASSAFLVELAKSKSQPFHLIELQLDSGTIYATDAARNIVWNGNTYPALSHFLEFSEIRESAELGVTNVTLALSGVDQTLIAAILGEDYIDRRVLVYRGFLDAADDKTVVVDPIALFDGRADEPEIVEDPTDGKCLVHLTATNLWGDGRRPGRHTNHDEQQIYFSGDTFFSRVSELSKPVLWGRGGGSTVVNRGGVGQEVGGAGKGRFGSTTDGNPRGTNKGRDFD